MSWPCREHGGFRGSPLALRQLKDQLSNHYRSSTLGSRALWTNKADKARREGWFWLLFFFRGKTQFVHSLLRRRMISSSPQTC